MAMTPPTLKETSARVVKVNSISFSADDLPMTVIDYLLSANCCVNPECKGEKVVFLVAEDKVVSAEKVDFPHE